MLADTDKYAPSHRQLTLGARYAIFRQEWRGTFRTASKQRRHQGQPKLAAVRARAAHALYSIPVTCQHGPDSAQKVLAGTVIGGDCPQTR